MCRRRVNDATLLPSEEVGTDELVVVDRQDVAQLARCHLSQGLQELLLACDGLGERHGEVHHGDVVDGHADRDAGELSCEGGQDELNGGGGACGRWDNVGADGATQTAGLFAVSVENVLGRRRGVNLDETAQGISTRPSQESLLHSRWSSCRIQFRMSFEEPWQEVLGSWSVRLGSVYQLRARAASPSYPQRTVQLAFERTFMLGS